jgi:hypothetical protein
MTPSENVMPVAGLLVIDSVTVLTSLSPAIAIRGELTVGNPSQLVLRGSRQTICCDIVVTGSRWSATVPLLNSVWGGPLLPPRSGRYVVIASDAAGAPLAIEVDAELPASQLIEGATRVSFDDLEEGRFSVPSLTTISPDKPLIAKEAVARLAARLDGLAEVDSVELDIPFRLVARESTIGR